MMTDFNIFDMHIVQVNSPKKKKKKSVDLLVLLIMTLNLLDRIGILRQALHINNKP